MKILITGATGFIGKKLTRALLAEGHSLSVLTRDAGRAKTVFAGTSPKLSFYHWDPEGERFPQTALDGVDTVIHLAGEGIAERRWSEAQKKRIRDSRVRGTRNLVDAILKKPGKKPHTLISASAIGWYGNRLNETVQEDSPPGKGFLAEVCREWEAEVDKGTSELRVVKIRVGIVLGSEGGALKKLLPIFKWGAGGPVGSGKQWMSWIHVDDLVSLFVFAVNHDNVRGPVNGVAPNPVINAEFSRVLGRSVHRPVFMPAPAFMLKLALGEMAQIVLEGARVLPKRAEHFGFHFRFEHLSEALADICKKKIAGSARFATPSGSQIP